MADNKFGFGKIKSRFFQIAKPQLPKLLGQHMLLFYRTNYNKEGYENKTFIPWAQRKYTVNRKLLVKTGALRDGIYVKSQTFSKIEIGNDVDYFEYHNEGTNKLPTRPIIYESETLEKELEKIIDAGLSKLFR